MEDIDKDLVTPSDLADRIAEHARSEMFAGRAEFEGFVRDLAVIAKKHLGIASTVTRHDDGMLGLWVDTEFNVDRIRTVYDGTLFPVDAGSAPAWHLSIEKSLDIVELSLRSEVGTEEHHVLVMINDGIPKIQTGEGTVPELFGPDEEEELVNMELHP